MAACLLEPHLERPGEKYRPPGVLSFSKIAWANLWALSKCFSSFKSCAAKIKTPPYLSSQLIGVDQVLYFLSSIRRLSNFSKYF